MEYLIGLAIFVIGVVIGIIGKCCHFNLKRRRDCLSSVPVENFDDFAGNCLKGTETE